MCGRGTVFDKRLMINTFLTGDVCPLSFLYSAIRNAPVKQKKNIVRVFEIPAMRSR